ncbi:hypothetical protein RFI_12738 [Reticulomyxa filosa]|uniref:Uncharacterized protein n=1 Tax=Reticulomyxa filosa TaxID=46433 RepID=X6NFB7_RETFI|nr:hypothetical protein RFI_12738 [Reticulomyxa filosa]|eukprot:ETO24419.1 hypothetical protein RFI_12738 [Reticulomyxa filosa]
MYANEYGAMQSFDPYLKECLLRVSKTTLTLLSNKQKFEEHPDIVEDYFELMVSLMKRNPSLIVQNMALMEKIFVKGLDGMLLHHRKALESICHFYECSIALAKSRSHHSIAILKRHHKEGETQGSESKIRNSSTSTNNRDIYFTKLLHSHGKTLVGHILKGLIHGTVLSSVNKLEQVLEEFYQFNKDILQEYIQFYPSPKEFFEMYFCSAQHKDRRKCVSELWRAAQRYLLRTKY